MTTTDLPMLTVTRLFFALLALGAICVQLVLHIGASYSALNFFSYFTNLSNLFAVVVLLFSVSGKASARSASRDLARYLSAVNMAVVGLVFAILLRDVDLGALLPWVNFVLHYVMPVVVVVDWLVQPPVVRLRATHLLLALVFPWVYLTYVVVRGAAMGWYPYPFLNPLNVGGYAGVAMYAGGIAVTFMGAGWALLWAGNRRAGASAHS